MISLLKKFHKCPSRITDTLVTMKKNSVHNILEETTLSCFFSPPKTKTQNKEISLYLLVQYILFSMSGINSQTVKGLSLCPHIKKCLNLYFMKN